MKEIKVKKVVVLKDCYYYFNKLCDEIASEITSASENNDKEKIHRYAFARELLAGMTRGLTEDIFRFKCIDKDYDIDSAVKKYNDNCNFVIRELINKEGELIMKEIKVEKDVVLRDGKYYLNEMLDKIYAIWESLDFVNRRKESFDRAYDLFRAKELLSEYTYYLEMDILVFKSKLIKDYDIDTDIRNYNNVCNTVIREFINKEGT